MGSLLNPRTSMSPVLPAPRSPSSRSLVRLFCRRPKNERQSSSASVTRRSAMYSPNPVVKCALLDRDEWSAVCSERGSFVQRALPSSLPFGASRGSPAADSTHERWFRPRLDVHVSCAAEERTLGANVDFVTLPGRVRRTFRTHGTFALWIGARGFETPGTHRAVPTPGFCDPVARELVFGVGLLLVSAPRTLPRGNHLRQTSPASGHGSEVAAMCAISLIRRGSGRTVPARGAWSAPRPRATAHSPENQAEGANGGHRPRESGRTRARGSR